jgi:hypothetical protein
MLLDLLIDEPSGRVIPFWRQRQRSWRTRPVATPAAQRAHETWGVIATKHYATGDPQRPFWIQINPYADTDDARKSLLKTIPLIREGLAIRITEDSTGPMMTAAGFVEVVTRLKVGSVAPTASVVHFQNVLGVIDCFLVIFSFASKDAPWSWDDIQMIVELQGKRICDQRR